MIPRCGTPQQNAAYPVESKQKTTVTETVATMLTLQKSTWESCLFLFFFVSAPSQLLGIRPEWQRQQPPPLSIFTVPAESLCITITFPACLHASTSGRDGKGGVSGRWGEEGGLEDEICPSSDRAGGSPVTRLCVDGVGSSGCNFSLQCVGGMTV